MTVAICPGIGNTSESVYIRTYVHYSQCHGYRCAVLNHIGALNSVPVTGNRIFSYGKINTYYLFMTLIMRMTYLQELQCVLLSPTYVCSWQTLKLLNKFWCRFHQFVESLLYAKNLGLKVNFDICTILLFSEFSWICVLKLRLIYTVQYLYNTINCNCNQLF